MPPESIELQTCLKKLDSFTPDVQMKLLEILDKWIEMEGNRDSNEKYEKQSDRRGLFYGFIISISAIIGITIGIFLDAPWSAHAAFGAGGISPVVIRFINRKS